MADEQKGAGGPKVPSGAMYIGLCQTRSRATDVRWHYAVAFITLNGVVATLCVNLLNFSSSLKMAGVAALLAVMVWFNWQWRLLDARTNQWVEHYTALLANIERAHGTESGVMVFAAEGHLSKSATDSLVQGNRFRAVITRLNTTMIVLSGASAIATALCVVYLAGQGRW